MKRLAGVALLFVGCGRGIFGPSPQEIRAQSIEVRAAQSDILLTCNGRPSPPSKQTVYIGESPVAVECGLIANEVVADGFKKNFIDKACAGKADDACQKRYADMFFARMDVRYSQADWGAVATRCTAYPVECGDWRIFEAWALQSHSMAVGRQASDEHADADAAPSSGASGWAVAAAAVQGALSPYRQGINCTSHTTGGFTNTNCR